MLENRLQIYVAEKCQGPTICPRRVVVGEARHDLPGRGLTGRDTLIFRSSGPGAEYYSTDTAVSTPKDTSILCRAP